jgi:hypothetical protein
MFLTSNKGATAMAPPIPLRLASESVATAQLPARPLRRQRRGRHRSLISVSDITRLGTIMWIGDSDFNPGQLLRRRFGKTGPYRDRTCPSRAQLLRVDRALRKILNRLPHQF